MQVFAVDSAVLSRSVASRALITLSPLREDCEFSGWVRRLGP